MNLKTLIRTKSPVYLPLDKWHNRRGKNRFLALLQRCEEMDAREVSAWQLAKAAQLVDYAYLHVPFYRRLYDGVGYRCGDLSSWDDFYRLPFVTKDDIKRDLAAFTSDEARRLGASLCHTGGSIAKPMEFYLDKQTVIRESAFFEYYWRKNGYRYGEKCVVLRGNQVANEKLGKFSAPDQTKHYLLLDSRYVTQRCALEGIDRDMKGFGARVLQAYPSSAYCLAKSYAAARLSPPHFDLIFLSSENTYPEQIAFIKSIFTPRQVLYHYGHSECAAVAIKYAGKDALGFCPVYGITEFLNGDEPVQTAGEMGEIVATGFNYATPFIRYRTADFAVRSDYKSTDYMKNYLAAERIEGRLHEFIVTKDGRLISICTVGGAHLPSLSLIGDMQYEQFEKGRLTVYVAPAIEAESITSDVVRRIYQDFCSYFKGSVEVSIEIRNKMAQTVSGKKVLLKQHLDIEKFR